MRAIKMLGRMTKALFTQPDAIRPILNEYRISAMKEAVAARWPNVPTDILFDDTADNCDPPMTHDAAVERVKYNRLGLTLATGIERRNKMRAMLFAGLVLCIVSVFALLPTSTLFGDSRFVDTTLSLTAWAVCSVLFLIFCYLSLGISPLLYEALLPKRSPLRQEDIDDANAFVERVLKKHSGGDDIPDDLADRWRSLGVDANGEPVDGQVLPIDFRVSEFKEALKAGVSGPYFAGLGTIAALLAVAAFLHSLYGFIAPQLSTQASTFAALGNYSAQAVVFGLAFNLAIVLFTLTLAKLFLMADRAERRAVQAQIASETSPTARMVEEVGREPFIVNEHARKRQLANASGDGSTFLQIGKSTKTMAARRDVFAPSEYVPFGMTVRDLSTHLLMLGDTGTGKTAGGIRPVLWQWIEAEAGGAVVLDGKGALPREVATDDRFQLITPETVAYNPIAGLTPDDVANTLYEQNASGDGDSAFWEQSAMRLVRASAVMLAVAVERGEGEWKWTLGDLYKVACTESGQNKLSKVIQPLHKESKLSDHETRAADYRFREFPATPDKMRGSILGYAQAWLTGIVDNEDLARWVDSDASDVDITDALRGGILAFDLPEAIYGPAGPALSSMIKSQLYRALKIRGDLSAAQEADASQAAVLMLIDECQEVVAQDDVAMLPIARSLGLRAFFSTQALDGIYLKLGEDATQTLLAQFRSVVSLTVNGQRTKEFVSERMGAGYRMQLFSATASQSDATSAAIAATRTPGGFTPGSAGYETAWRSETTNAMRSDFGIGGDIRAATDQLASTLGLHDTVSSMSIYRHRRHAPSTFSIAKTAFVEPEEVPLLTSAPFLALASINRANVPRRDLIELEPMFAFPEKEKASEEEQEKNESDLIEVGEVETENT